MNKQTIITTLIGGFGVALGFFLNFLKSRFEELTKGKRYYYATSLELVDAIEKIKEKINWLSRDVSKEELKCDKNLLVEYENKLLFLGEDESFTVDLKFWSDNLKDIVSVVNNNSFIYLFSSYKLIKKFESKFKDMKFSFKVNTGNSKEIALNCYKDLLKIYKDLQEQVKSFK